MLSSWRTWVNSFQHIPPESNPFSPPKNGKCPVDDLPDELLSYIFHLGVDIQQMEWEDEYSSSDNEEDVWEDVGDSDDSDDSDDAADDCSTSEPQSIADVGEQDESLPFQVLVSHICRRWRSAALGTHNLWTTVAFGPSLNIEKAKAFINRSNGLPLAITIDCTVEDDDLERLDAAQKDVFKEDLDRPKRYLSQLELHVILDILSPEVYHWGKFIFYGSTYDYVERLMLGLRVMPMAPVLESFQVYIYSDDCGDYEVYPGSDITSYLPFHGEAPNLKEAVFWGIHIDWEGAVPNFLRGLRVLELSYLTKDVRPSYSTFAQIVKNSPELHTLTLTLAGPVLANGVAFDSEEGWGRETLDIPSLREFALQFHDPPYASALIQHLNMPNVTNLVLDFEDGDYSDFVQTLAKPIKGQKQSILQHITHLEISGLPCNDASVEVLLSQLTVLQSLKLKLFGPEEEVIFAKLIEPRASTIGSARDTPATPSEVLRKVFCPKLEELTTSVETDDLKCLITSRREAGAPLKRVNLVIDSDESLSTDDETWIRSNVEELHFYEPSDSEDEVEVVVDHEQDVDSDDEL